MKLSYFSSSCALVFAAAAASKTPPCTGVTSLRSEAEQKNVLIGSGAISPPYLNDSQFANVLSEQFNSLSSENELKWSSINPSKGVYNWATIDRLVDFADQNEMVVKGHGLISGSFNPDYVLDISDATTLRSAMQTHFDAVLQRYHGKLDRWDVVTEALQTQGGGLQNNTFLKVLGPDYVGEAFRIAHRADPSATLFLCENQVETLSGKRQELYELVSGLVAEGVPVHGIALQMHITEVAPEPGVITEIADSYRALGLETTIAEMDVHTYDLDKQAGIYAAVIAESLQAGITDISFWGFTDKHAYTWLPGAEPLMFDEQYSAKGAFYATHSALAEFGREA